MPWIRENSPSWSRLGRPMGCSGPTTSPRPTSPCTSSPAAPGPSRSTCAPGSSPGDDAAACRRAGALVALRTDERPDRRTAALRAGARRDHLRRPRRRHPGVERGRRGPVRPHARRSARPEPRSHRAREVPRRALARLRARAARGADAVPRHGPPHPLDAARRIDDLRRADLRDHPRRRWWGVARVCKLAQGGATSPNAGRANASSAGACASWSNSSTAPGADGRPARGPAGTAGRKPSSGVLETLPSSSLSRPWCAAPSRGAPSDWSRPRRNRTAARKGPLSVSRRWMSLFGSCRRSSGLRSSVMTVMRPGATGTSRAAAAMRDGGWAGMARRFVAAANVEHAVRGDDHVARCSRCSRWLPVPPVPRHSLPDRPLPNERRSAGRQARAGRPGRPAARRVTHRRPCGRRRAWRPALPRPALPTGEPHRQRLRSRRS